MERLGAATEEWRVAVPHKGADDPTEMAGSLVYQVPWGRAEAGAEAKPQDRGHPS